MKKIEVEGMHRLNGEVRVQGSKNAVLPILSACVLSQGETILHGCPKIRDVAAMLEVLRHAGASIHWEEDGTLVVNTSAMRPVPLLENTKATRSSVMLLGSFIARFGRAQLGYPGGCKIGKRPIDFHEQALKAMGVTFCENEKFFEAKCSFLKGCDIYLPYPSVGVTENVLLAAVGAAGMTRIYGAAREPEIIELCRFLRVLGVRIYGIGTSRIFVIGGAVHKNAEYCICADRIVAGTYLLAGAGTEGEILLRNVPSEHMGTIFRLLGELGAVLQKNGNDVKLTMSQRPRGIPFVCTAPYPGFPTDLQSQLMAVLCRAEQKSRIEERIFEDRFLIVEELRKMGADICTKERNARIYPVKKLQGAQLCVRDLRGGAALLIAALEAEGVSCIGNTEIIDRGYEDIVGDFQKLGAKIAFEK